VLDDSGAETAMYTIPAGGRRFRALELLVSSRRMNKTALVPCVVRTDGLAEEDSLAENVQRALLHPLDQFRAFQAMREKGRTEPRCPFGPSCRSSGADRIQEDARRLWWQAFCRRGQHIGSPTQAHEQRHAVAR
jgi:hypothetical protein